ncbi:MAG: HD domain-containing protein [Deltaproteobacteria bacterium]|nr:HD domain-containing protein [Deltaproteobacteria bacterium]
MKTFLKDLKENENFDTLFLVTQKNLMMSKANKPYLSLKLMDKSGEGEGKVWDNVDFIESQFEKNDFIRVVGRAVLFQDKLQLNVVKVERLNPDLVDVSDFLPTSKRDIDEMVKTLFEFIQQEVKNTWIQKFLKSIFEDREIIKLFKRSPAAKTNHHAWIGGLLEHVVHLCELGRDVLKHYPQVNADLVYTGLMLHDIGKIYEMTSDRFFEYTDDGQLIGHLIQGVEMVYEKIRLIPQFPPKLKTHIVHLILSHHGKLEYGSPKLPMTLEAIMVHYLDDLDSKIQGVLDLSEKENRPDSNWVSFNRLFGRPMYQATLKDVQESESQMPSPQAPKKTHPKAPLTSSLGDLLQKSLKS